MAIAFYTTRLTLQVLGDEDYGINNVIGGLISVFAMISMPITGALQRFFNVEFTKQEIPKRVVFSSSIRILTILSIGMVILYETIGLYLVNNVLQYPDNRSFAVNIIFQLTVITSVISFYSLAYSSYLFSKEDMGIPATAEVISSLLKLGMLLIIPFVSLDALIAYSSALLLLSVFKLLFYFVYCRCKYEDTIWTREKNSALQKSILSFSGWSSINAFAGISLTYLSNIFINIFGGVIYNTAYGISMQLSNAIISFSSNVLKAVDPQITSATVAGQEEYRNQITLTTIKISLLIVGLFYVIFCFYGHVLLQVWLGHVPAYVFDFCQVKLLIIVFTSIVLPLRTIIMAVGDIKRFFMNFGIMALTANILMLLLLYLGASPITVVYLILAVYIGYFIDALLIVQRVSSLTIKRTLSEVLRVIVSLIIGACVLAICKRFIGSSISAFAISLLPLFMTIILLLYFFIFNEKEKQFIKSIIKKIKK